MKLSRIFLCGIAGVIFAGACVQHRATAPATPAVTRSAARTPPAYFPNSSNLTVTPPVYVPDISHASGPLPDGVLAWDSLSKETNAPADADAAHFTFNFTNVSGNNVVILNVHPSCGCTTAKLPPVPWTLSPSTNGEIQLSVNVAGKSGTLFKTVNVSTDKGSKTLMLKITILPTVVPTLSAAERMRGVTMAKADRQAVFHEDCASCHVKHGEGKYGEALYQADCAICHEASPRATMVPDLHALKVPTNDQFWQTWISHGKPGSLMPAFCTADGGPLTDMQIASLAAYLDSAIPSHVPAFAQ